MEDDDATSPPTVPTVSSFRRLHQRRDLIARLDNSAAAYWQALVADCQPYADAAFQRALERYAENRPTA